jgi:hypothetical protein
MDTNLPGAPIGWPRWGVDAWVKPLVITHTLLRQAAIETGFWDLWRALVVAPDMPLHTANIFFLALRAPNYQRPVPQSTRNDGTIIDLKRGCPRDGTHSGTKR